jgi:copper chaperone CopZ
MKTTKLLVLLSAIFLFSGIGMAQDKTENKKKKGGEDVTFVVSMFCENCKAKIERHISWEKGVKDLKVNLDKKLVSIKYDPKKTNEEALKKAIEALEYTCEKQEEALEKPTE